MPSNDWSAFGLTALGGVLAAGGGWVNGWTQSRRERRKDNLAVKRGAYVEFMYQGQAFYLALNRLSNQINTTAHSGLVTTAPDLHADIGQFFRASSALRLCASSEVVELAQELEVGVRAYYDLVRVYQHRPPEKAELETVLNEVEMLSIEIDVASRRLSDAMKHDLRA